MKLKMVAITQPIDLGDYNEAMKGGVIDVWVNPPKSVRREREELLQAYAKFLRHAVMPDGEPASKRSILQRMIDLFRAETPKPSPLQEIECQVHAWFAGVWSQGANPELHWSADEVAEISERDPALYQWLIRKSVLMIDAFLVDKKK